jgi:hypothetical protein
MATLATALLLLIAVSATLPTSNGFTVASFARMNLPSLRVTDPASIVDGECAVDEDTRSTAPLYPTFPERERLLYEALGKFVNGNLDEYFFEPTSGGVNNVVFYVTKKGGANDGTKTVLGVLRIYNNSNDDARVEFEHGILEKLGEKRAMFSFGIPETIID